MSDPNNNEKDGPQEPDKREFPPWNVLIRDFTQTTTLHGLQYLGRDTFYYIRRLLWVIILLTAASCFIALVSNKLKVFLDNGKSTIIDVHYADEPMDFPSVTICNLNTYKRTELQKAALQDVLRVLDSNEYIDDSEQFIRPGNGDRYFYIEEYCHIPKMNDMWWQRYNTITREVCAYMCSNTHGRKCSSIMFNADTTTCILTSYDGYDFAPRECNNDTNIELYIRDRHFEENGTTKGVECDFELRDGFQTRSCIGFENDDFVSKSEAWKAVQGRGNTPSSDATLESDRGHYLLFSETAQRPGFTARYLSEFLMTMGSCVEFIYRFLGENCTLNVYLKATNLAEHPIFTVQGSQPINVNTGKVINEFNGKKVRLNLPEGIYQIVIEGQRPSTGACGIAIDNLAIRNCSEFDNECLQSGRGQHYTGTVSTTATGDTCLNWDQVELDNVQNNLNLFPDYQRGAHSYVPNGCRNAFDYMEKPYCYYIEHYTKLRRSVCDIPMCVCNKPNMFQCTSGLCVSNSLVCDGRRDCNDGSDEILPCESKIQIPCDFEEEFICGYDLNLYTTNISWVRQSSQGAAIQNSPPRDGSTSTIGHYLMIDNRQSQKGERSSFRTPFISFEQNISVKFSSFIDTSDDDTVTSIQVYLIDIYGRRKGIMYIVTDKTSNGKWIPRSTVCLSNANNMSYAIEFEATIGFSQVGIAIDNVDIVDDCPGSTPDNDQCDEMCEENEECYYTLHQYHDGLKNTAMLFQSINITHYIVEPQLMNTECREFNLVSLLIEANKITPGRSYRTTFTSPIYMNATEEQCITFSYLFPRDGLTVELVHDVRNNSRKILFEDKASNAYLAQSIRIPPQTAPYVMNYIIDIERWENNGDEDSIIAFLPPDCTSVDNGDNNDCQCGFQSKCDYHLIPDKATAFLVEVTENATVSNLTVSLDSGIDKAFKLVRGENDVILSVLRKCKIFEERCFSFEYICSNQSVSEVAIRLISSITKDSVLPIESGCNDSTWKEMYVSLPREDYAVAIFVPKGSEEELVIDKLRMSQGVCRQPRAGAFVDLSRTRMPDTSIQSDMSNLNFPSTQVPTITREKFVTFGEELGNVHIMTKHLQDKYLHDVLNTMSHDLGDTILRCVYDNAPCEEDNFVQVVTDMGVCYSFNYNTSVPKNNTKTILKTGTGSGLEILLNVQKYDHTDSPKTRSGVKVFLHDQNEIPYVTSLGQNIPTGVHSLVAIDKLETSRLDKPYGLCTKPNEEPLYYPDFPYTYNRCKRGCETKYLNGVCGCKNLYMPETDNIEDCGIFQYFNCSYQATVNRNTALSQTCDCIEACEEVTYTGIESSSVLSEYNVDYFLNYQRDKMDKAFREAVEIRYRTNRAAFNRTINGLTGIVEAYDKIQEFIIREVVDSRSSYIGIFETILDKMMRQSKEDILSLAFQNYTIYYDVSQQQYDDLWEGIATSLKSIVQPIQKMHTLLMVEEGVLDKWLERVKDDVCNAIDDSKMALFLYNESATILTNESSNVVPEIELLIKPVCKEKFKKLEVLLAELEATISCTETQSLANLTRDVIESNGEIIMIVTDYADECTVDYHNFVVDFFAWARGVNSSLTSNSEIPNIKGTFSNYLNVDSTQVELNEGYNYFSQIKENYTSSTISIYQLSSQLSNQEYRNRIQDLEDLKVQIEESIVQPFRVRINQRRSQLISWFRRTMEYAYQLGNRLVNDSSRFEDDIKQMRLWRKPLPTADNNKGIYFEYDEGDIQQSWPDEWAFDRFYNFRADYIIKNRIDTFFHTLTDMLDVVEHDLDQLVIELQSNIEILNDHLATVVQDNQMDGNFVMDNFLQINIYFRELKYTSISQSPDYDIVSFFSDIGGFLGLLLGASCITICEFLDLIFYNSAVKTALHATREKEKKEMARAQHLPLQNGLSNSTKV